MMRFRTVTCQDAEVSGLEVFRMLAPSDWESEGGVVWNLNCPAMPAGVAFRVTAPSGTEALEFFPSRGHIWSPSPMFGGLIPPGMDYGGSEALEPLSAQDYLEQIVVPRYRNQIQGWRVVGKEPLPDLARELGAQALQQGMGRVDAARLWVVYPDGSTEEFYGFCYYYQPPVFFGAPSFITWSADFLTSFRAAEGELEAHRKVFETMVASRRANPLWLQKYLQLVQMLTQQQIQAIHHIGQISRIVSTMSDQVSDMVVQTAQERDQAYDRIFDNVSQGIRGVDRWVDGQGAAVELPTGYESAWTNGIGEYVVSDDPGFDPNQAYQGSWNPLKRDA